MWEPQLVAALQRACLLYAGSVALVGDGVSLTFGQVSAKGEALAEQLRQAGVGKCDVVMVKCSNHPSDFVAFFAVWMVGAVAAPAHRTSPPEVVATIQSKARCRAVIDALHGDPAGAVQRLPDMKCADAPERQRLLSSAALVIFTSGSTGLPKGVVLSQDRFYGKLLQNQRLFQTSSDTVSLLVLNNTFSFGIWVALMTLMQGGRVIMQSRFNPAVFLETLASQGVTFLGVVPTMVRAMFASLDEAHIERARQQIQRAGRLRSVSIGGEPLGPQLSAQFREFLAPAALYDVYGLTETSTSDFVLDPSDYPEHPASIGRPFPGIQYRIVDERGHACGPHLSGELQLKTPYLMAGYLGDENLTSEAFQDGWFRTGDLAIYDEDGFVTIVGRLKELIVRGGNKITPIEVERALRKCTDVADAMVTGMPDPILGQRIHALLVPRGNAQIDVSRLRGELADALEKYKLPDAFYIGTALPTGRTGKVDRGQLLRSLASGHFPCISS